jgi:hypothetical protein
MMKFPLLPVVLRHIFWFVWFVHQGVYQPLQADDPDLVPTSKTFVLAPSLLD